MTHRATRLRKVRCVRLIFVAGVLVAVAAACRHEEERVARVTPARAGLTFTRYASAEKPSVWVADADGSHARRVVTRAYSPQLSPDGRRLAYMVPSADPNALPILVVRDLARGKPRHIAPTFAYEWSPDGRRLVVHAPNSLFLFDVRNGKGRELVGRHVLGGSSFAPDGRAVAYGRSNGGAGRDYRSDIFVIELRTGRVERLTRNGHSDQPVWGGGWIIYRRFHFSGDWSIGRLHLMRPDGSRDHLFARGDERTSLARMGLDPLELSRNGKVLLACDAAEFHCPPVVFVVPRGVGASFGVTIRRLAHAGELASAADLSRDGRAVLFTVGPFDSPVGGRLYATRLDGGDPRLLLRNASEASWAR